MHNLEDDELMEVGILDEGALDEILSGLAGQPAPASPESRELVRWS